MKLDDFHGLPPYYRDAVFGFCVAVTWAIVGRLMYHARQVQVGRRRFLSYHLIWELPVAFGTGLIGNGLADYFGLQGAQATGIIVTVSYLGPGFVEGVVWRFINRIAPPPPPPPASTPPAA